MRSVTDTTSRNLETEDPDQFLRLQSYFEQHPSELEEPITEEERYIYNEAAEIGDFSEEKMHSSELLYRAWAKFYISNKSLPILLIEQGANAWYYVITSREKIRKTSDH